jgi:DNA-binding NarL/FixJ family response regulator
MLTGASPLHVFLADDSVAIRDRVNALLTAEGLHVAGGAGTPQECIAAILASRPDVVVLDVQLEGGSGLQVLNAVRPVAPEVAFVVFSNNSGPAYRARYLGQGAVGFLDKSTEFDQLARAVRSAGHRTSQ